MSISTDLIMDRGIARQNRARRMLVCAFSIMPLLFTSCTDPLPTSTDDNTLAFSHDHDRDPAGVIIGRWVEQSLQTVRAQNIGTPNAGRLYAMVTTAMYDAVNGIDRQERCDGRTHALVPPDGAPEDGSRRAAATAAAHAVLTALAPAQTPMLDSALTADLAQLGNDADVTAGRAWGEHVGQQVVLLRSNDGTQAAVIIPAGTGIGEHRQDFDARFRNMTPFGIASKEPYDPGPPPALNSSAYAEAFEDVKRLGDPDGDADRNRISDFWLAGAGTVREPGVWPQAALSIVRQQDTERDISRTARVFALVGIAVADAILVSWEAKAKYFSWRPTPAIHEADRDGNRSTSADPNWISRIGSPGSSPEWTSGTSTFAGAATRALEAVYSTGLDFCFASDGSAGRRRCYSSPLHAAVEAGRSRIYQGIHFQFSNLAGRATGRALASEIVATRLQRVDDHDRCR